MRKTLGFFAILSFCLIGFNGCAKNITVLPQSSLFSSSEEISQNNQSDSQESQEFSEEISQNNQSDSQESREFSSETSLVQSSDGNISQIVVTSIPAATSAPKITPQPTVTPGPSPTPNIVKVPGIVTGTPQEETVVISQIQITANAQPEVPAEGGEKSCLLTITVKNSSGVPIEGANVFFNVGTASKNFTMEQRTARLSNDSAVTNSSGVATSTYTTLAADNKMQTIIGVTVNNLGEEYADLMINHEFYIIATNQPVRIKGSVNNPFNGQKISNTSLHILLDNADNVFRAAVDSSANYDVLLTAGLYNLYYTIDVSSYVSGNYEGSYYRINNGELQDSLQVNLNDANSTYIANFNKGIIKGVHKNFSGKELAIAPYINGVVRTGELVLVKISSDGTFLAPLNAGDHDVFIKGHSSPFIRRLNVKAGQINDLGKIS